MVRSNTSSTLSEPYRYALENSSRKYNCPECGKKKFVRYVDTETQEYLPERYGRCDREANCRYHLSPKTDGYAKMNWEKEKYLNNWEPAARISQPLNASDARYDPVSIPTDVLGATLKGYRENVFLNNLMQRVAFPFAEEDIEKVVGQYYLGTTNRGFWAGAITFPYIDINHRTKAIQVKKFNQQNHTDATTWIHSIIEKHYQTRSQPIPDWIEPYKNNDLKVSCLFGEHLLSKYPDNPVALVEAPKTAVYATMYFGFPNDPKKPLWLAVFNLSSLNHAKCRALQGRKVVLFPDLSKDGHAFKKWSSQAEELERLIPGTSFKVSDLLEEVGQQEERENGADLADYLIKLDWRKFRSESSTLP